MFGFSNMIKRWDVIITALLVLLSFLPIAVFSYYQNEKTANNGDAGYVAVISVDNKEVRRIPLTGNTKNEVFDIHIDENNHNTIEVEGDRVHIKGATCYDQVCVQMGYVSKPGETVVCLPNRVVIEVESMDGNVNPDDEIIIST